MRKFLRHTTILSLAFACFFAGGGLMKAVSADADYDSLRRFSQTLDMVEQYYVEDVSQTDLIDGALKGMLQELDPHSTMMNKSEFKELRETSTGKFSGIGVEITSGNGVVLVVSPIADTPAFRAGLRSGDQILSIDGQFTDKMSLSEAATKMRGTKGTKVTLLVLHKDTNEPISIEIKRDDIPFHTVKAKELGAGYHWIRLTRFSENTTKNLKDALDEAKSKGDIKGIILDLRNNPGGLVDQSINVADMFLESGTIMSMRGRDKDNEQTYKAKQSKDDVKAPLVVLVNAGSASASEIVAGALRDHNRAFIVGERTFGKGSVQNVIPLPDGTGLKLTVALYYTPSGKSIQAEGIVPDFEVIWEKPEEKEKGITIRETNLQKHLEVSKQDKDSEESKVDEEVSELLRLDNQLRLALQFVKSVPVMQNLK